MISYFLGKALDIKDDLIKWRRDIHEYPELGFELARTSLKVEDFLKNEGIKYKKTAQSGICALIEGKGTKTVALRADMDALPVYEKNNCSYKSKIEGRMHACGHDAHTAVLMGVAHILNGMKESLNGNVKLLFEPAEETTGGSKIMIKEGVLENPHVDAVIGLHVDESIECGTIGIKNGVVNAASNPFSIKIYGKGGHGAHPDTAIDPVIIACNVINALQTIVSREIPPEDAAVITIGSIHGGKAQNVIPDEVEIGGIIRTMKSEHRDYVKRRLKEITEGIVHSMRGSCSIEIEESYPCLYNDDSMTALLMNSADDVIGSHNINILEKPSMGVESFAYFAMERPSVFYYLGSANAQKGTNHPAHGSYFDIDEDCLPIGTAIQCSCAVNYLNSDCSKVH